MRFWILVAFLVSSLAQAESLDVYSRAFQQAKRVAAHENNKDIPSRAFWLGSRVVQKSKSISYKTSKTRDLQSPKKN